DVARHLSFQPPGDRGRPRPGPRAAGTASRRAGRKRRRRHRRGDCSARARAPGEGRQAANAAVDGWADLMSDWGPIEARLIDNRYQLLAIIGKGGHGVVYRAIDRETGGEVAIKFLHDQVAVDPQYNIRMLREAQVMAALAGT